MRPKIFFSLVLMGLFLAGCSKSATAPPADADDKKAPSEEDAAPTVSHDTNGNVVIAISDEIQGNLGLVVKKPETAQVRPEIMGYGRVLDPASLTAMMNDLAAAQAAYNASSNEWARLKTLSGQGNTSARALQAAEAAAQKDQLAVEAAKDRFALPWGRATAEISDLGALSRALISLDAVLLRIDLPAGEASIKSPAGARIFDLEGKSAKADFLAPAASTDPQMQGRGYLFLAKDNPLRLVPGDAVTGYIETSGEPLTGVIIPRDAVVRTEAAAWIYRLKAGGEGFTRSRIELQHPTEKGWLLTKGITAADYIVVDGAQQLLSIEMRGGGPE